MGDIDTAIIDAKRRATGYQDVDGLPFLALSALAFLMGCSSLWLRRISPDLAVLATFAVCIGWFFVGSPDAPVMQWLKSRITYPRTGFVALPQPGAPGNAANEADKQRKLLGGMAFAALLAGAALSDYVSNRWIECVAMTAGIAAVCLAYRGDRRMRFMWLLIPSSWLSTWIAARLQLSRTQETPFVIFAFAMFSFIVGAVRLVRYLMQHRLPQQ